MWLRVIDCRVASPSIFAWGDRILNRHRSPSNIYHRHNRPLGSCALKEENVCKFVIQITDEVVGAICAALDDLDP
jgi:hypothetical protein